MMVLHTIYKIKRPAALRVHRTQNKQHHHHIATGALPTLSGFFNLFLLLFPKKTTHTHATRHHYLLWRLVVDIAAARVCTREVAFIYNMLTIII